MAFAKGDVVLRSCDGVCVCVSLSEGILVLEFPDSRARDRQEGKASKVEAGDGCLGKSGQRGEGGRDKTFA